MAKYTEWSNGLEEALAAPFPREAHKTKRQGGAEITFVSWHEYAARLNELVGPQGWSAGEPIFREVAGKLVMGVPVTILGVTKINFGDEDEGKDNYGTAVTNAWAMAFKRACALFGLGLYLYDKDWRAKATQQRRPRHGSHDRNAPATDDQLRAIDRLAVERVIPVKQEEAFKRRLAAGLTQAGADDAIRWLESLPMAQEPAV